MEGRAGGTVVRSEGARVWGERGSEGRGEGGSEGEGARDTDRLTGARTSSKVNSIITLAPSHRHTVSICVRACVCAFLRSFVRSFVRACAQVWPCASEGRSLRQRRGCACAWWGRRPGRGLRQRRTLS